MTTEDCEKIANQKILLCWDSLGFDIRGVRPGKYIAEEFNISVQESEIYPLFMFVDEALFCLRYVSYYLMSAIPLYDAKRVLPYLKINEALCSTAASIRLLCSFGHDNEARTLVRLLYELALIKSLFDIDPDISTEFETAIESDAANKFWHKYLAKDRALKFVRREVAARSLPWIGTVAGGELLEQIRWSSGLTAHPTSFATHLNWSRLLDRLDEKLIARRIGIESSFTLNSTLFLTAMAYSTSITYPFRTRDVIDPKVGPPAHKTAESFQEYTNKMIGMLLTLWLAIQPVNEKLRNLRAAKWQPRPE